MYVFLVFVGTCVVIKVKLDLIAPIEVFDVVISPSGHIVLLEWDIHRSLWCNSHSAHSGKPQKTQTHS